MRATAGRVLQRVAGGDRVIDRREFARFFVTGVLAAAANLVMVWVVSPYLPYSVALLAGAAAGASISFPLTKIFAFRSRTWQRSRQELRRFTVIYAVGVAIYWSVSMLFGHLVLPAYLPVRQADVLGALIGASVTTVTNYLGHRFYTYRHARAATARYSTSGAR